MTFRQWNVRLRTGFFFMCHRGCCLMRMIFFPPSLPPPSLSLNSFSLCVSVSERFITPASSLCVSLPIPPSLSSSLYVSPLLAPFPASAHLSLCLILPLRHQRSPWLSHTLSPLPHLVRVLICCRQSVVVSTSSLWGVVQPLFVTSGCNCHPCLAKTDQLLLIHQITVRGKGTTCRNTIVRIYL